MNKPVWRFLLANWWWITGLIYGVAVWCILRSGTTEVFGPLVAATSVAGSVVFFVQKQKLEEIQLFEKLFTQFNKRYEDLNDRLEDVTADNFMSKSDVQKVLDEYFNLCAEEYLFYTEGRIHQKVWQSWCRGIVHHLKHSRIRKYWDQEVNTNSHYGLNDGQIWKGAGLPMPHEMRR